MYSQGIGIDARSPQRLFPRPKPVEEHLGVVVFDMLSQQLVLAKQLAALGDRTPEALTGLRGEPERARRNLSCGCWGGLRGKGEQR